MVHSEGSWLRMALEVPAHRARTGLRPRPATATSMRWAKGGMPRTPRAWHTARSAASHTCRTFISAELQGTGVGMVTRHVM
jgi:hypothetical protein